MRSNNTASISPLSLFQEIVEESRKGYWIGNEGKHLLGSHFQAVYSLSHQRPIGYEALLTSRDTSGKAESPTAVLAATANEYERVLLDRLARYLHTKNFMEQSSGNEWLFLNIHPDVVLHGSLYGEYFGDMLQETGMPADRVVIEILENSISDNKRLARSVDYYRDLGCMIAIDNFGAGSSHFDRIWQINPDIVKLDRSIVVEMENNRTVQRMLPNLVALIHECGSLVLLEGIENDEQAIIAIDSGVDFVQGYFFATPYKDINCDVTSSCMGSGGVNLSALCGKYHTYTKSKARKEASQLAIYSEAFEKAVSEFLLPENPRAFADVLELSGVERCYVLDEKGRQVGTNYFPENHDEMYPLRFNYLGHPADAVWFRRPYFRRAVQNPGVMQFSRPYLSLTAGIICITLSICVQQADGEQLVLCCDVDWSDR